MRVFFLLWPIILILVGCTLFRGSFLKNINTDFSGSKYAGTEFIRWAKTLNNNKLIFAINGSDYALLDPQTLDIEKHLHLHYRLKDADKPIYCFSQGCVLANNKGQLLLVNSQGEIIKKMAIVREEGEWYGTLKYAFNENYLVIGYNDNHAKVLIFEPTTLELLDAFYIRGEERLYLRDLTLAGDTLYLLLEGVDAIACGASEYASIAIVAVDVRTEAHLGSKAFKASDLDGNYCADGGLIAYNPYTDKIIVLCVTRTAPLTTHLLSFSTNSEEAEVMAYNENIFRLEYDDYDSKMEVVKDDTILIQVTNTSLLLSSTGKVLKAFKHAISHQGYLYIYYPPNLLIKANSAGIVDNCSFNFTVEHSAVGATPSKYNTIETCNPLLVFTNISPTFSDDVELISDEHHYEFIFDSFVCPQ